MPGSIMKVHFSALGAVCILAACAPSIPDSNPGVGFSDYDDFRTQQERRDALLEAGRPSPTPTDPRIGEETLAVLAATRSGAGPSNVSGTAPVSSAGGAGSVAGNSLGAPLSATGAVVSTSIDNPNISDEQNFNAVAGRQSIESDAQRIQQQRLTRQEVAPVPVPTRSSNGRPNVVAYALTTQNRVGEPLYSRSGNSSSSQFQRACARFATADQAQEEFLAQGGPERDRRGLDPDGDGFACFWDPTPFRAARGG